MNINKKIEEIRRQPEHIRLRWVWGLVGISMTFIFLVWLFSLQAMFKKEAMQEKTQEQGIGETLSKLKESAPALKEVPISGQALGSAEQGVPSDNARGAKDVTQETIGTSDEGVIQGN